MLHLLASWALIAYTHNDWSKNDFLDASQSSDRVLFPFSDSPLCQKTDPSPSTTKDLDREIYSNFHPAGVVVLTESLVRSSPNCRLALFECCSSIRHHIFKLRLQISDSQFYLSVHVSRSDDGMRPQVRQNSVEIGTQMVMCTFEPSLMMESRLSFGDVANSFNVEI